MSLRGVAGGPLGGKRGGGAGAAGGTAAVRGGVGSERSGVVSLAGVVDHRALRAAAVPGVVCIVRKCVEGGNGKLCCSALHSLGNEEVKVPSLICAVSSSPPGFCCAERVVWLTEVSYVWH